MYQFCCYNYVKPEYGENAKLFYMKTSSFIVHVKANDNSKIMRKMLKEDWTLQIWKQKDYYLNEK